MKNPPSLNEVQQALLEMRQPYERRLLEIQDRRDQFLANHRQSTAEVDPVFVIRSNQLRKQVRECQRAVDMLPQSVYRTVVLCDPETEQMSIVALVRHEGEIPSLQVGEWSVACVSPTLRLLRSAVGEVITQGLVVSANGSPVMPEPKRRRAIDTLHAPPLSALELKRRDREARRQRFERFITDRKNREKEVQERLFRQRKAREDRELAIRDNLLREDEEREEKRKRDLAEWAQRHRAQLKGAEAEDDLAVVNGAAPSLDMVEPVPDEDPAPVEEEAHVPQATPEDAPESKAADTKDAKDRLDTRDAGTGQVWWILTGFAAGCVVGLFVLPHWFSLIGSLSAAVTSLLLRLSPGRTAERD